jgi:hypothetical protein
MPQDDCFMASMCRDYAATLANSEELTRLAVPDFTHSKSQTIYCRFDG